MGYVIPIHLPPGTRLCIGLVEYKADEHRGDDILLKAVLGPEVWLIGY